MPVWKLLRYFVLIKLLKKYNEGAQKRVGHILANAEQRVLFRVSGLPGLHYG